MTEKEILFKRLDEASNRELGQIAFALTGEDPFETNRLLLPSKVREQTIAGLKDVVNRGLVAIEKIKS